jgi:hypothetical protein
MAPGIASAWRREMESARESRRAGLTYWEQRRESRVLVVAAGRGVDLEAADLLRCVREHLRAMPSRPLDHLDLVVVGSGLSPEAAARLTALVREYARELCVLLGGTAGAGETLLAAGADAVWMQPAAALTSLLPAEPDRQVEGLCALLASAPAWEPETWRTLLSSADAATVGRAQHRFDRSRRLLEEQARSRLHPPDEEEVRALFTTLTRWVGGPGEFVSRWQARGIGALALLMPTHEDEEVAGELLRAYDPVLQGHLREGAGCALIESVGRVDGHEAAPGEWQLGGGWACWPDQGMQ